MEESIHVWPTGQCAWPHWCPIGQCLMNDFVLQFLAVTYAAFVMFGEVVFTESFQWVLYIEIVILMDIHRMMCSLRDLFKSLIICLLLGPLMNVLACVQVLHAWCNFTAELTRFADRRFHEVSHQRGRGDCNWVLPAGLVELWELCHVLPEVECSNPWLAACLHIPGP